MQGIISNIQRFSMHDGPGIRTTVFFKGCPLRCLWCHNPETYAFGRELRYKAADCAHCLSCVQACPNGALSVADERLANDTEKCKKCFSCVYACPSGALAVAGQAMTVAEVMEEIRRDAGMYEKTGGGATLSGGEAGAQYEFALALLRTLREAGIHAALDTCGMLPEEHFAALVQSADLVLFDIKHTDPETHRRLTGADNAPIFRNFRALDQWNTPAEVRMPFVPGFNDDEANIVKTAEMVRDSKSTRAAVLLGYHPLGQSKIYAFDQKGRVLDTQPPGRTRLAEVAKRMEDIAGKPVSYR